MVEKLFVLHYIILEILVCDITKWRRHFILFSRWYGNNKLLPTWIGSSLFMEGERARCRGACAFISSASNIMAVFWPGRTYTSRFLLLLGTWKCCMLTLGSIGLRMVLGEWERGRLREMSTLLADRAPRELDFQRGIEFWYLWKN